MAAVIRAVLFLTALCSFVHIHCAGSLSQGMWSRFSRLTSDERKTFIGLRARDSLAATAYLNLATTGERLSYYTNYWRDRETEKKDFERRCEYAFREFNRYNLLNDDRIPVYVVYGHPTNRILYAGKDLILLPGSVIIKPAEVWTYENEGYEFDFLKIKKGYAMIARSEFGRRVPVPCLREDTTASGRDHDSSGVLDFDIADGRFRQSEGLTRFEIYLNFNLEDTLGHVLRRVITIFDAMSDTLVMAKRDYLRPVNSDRGTFYDEINFALEPRKYRVRIELRDLKDGRSGSRELNVDLLEYASDVKEISDLILSVLIDTVRMEGEFDKPLGRMIPCATAVFPVRTPFYFYHEAYNLSTANGGYELNTTYEIYRKEGMKQEILDILIQDVTGAGTMACLSAKYHPFNLPAGAYIIIAKDMDKQSGKVRTAIAEFTLVGE